FAATGTFTVGVRVSNAGGSAVSGVQVQVNAAQAKVRQFSGAGTVAETSSYTLALSAGGPDTATIQGWSVNWGDGTVDHITGNPAAVYHRYGGGLPLVHVSATASDQDGSYPSNTQDVTVSAVAPTIALSGAASVNEGAPYTLTLGA